jgi:DNA-binding MarR family transcriptional regulator
MDQDGRTTPEAPRRPEGFAYLLVQLGTWAARRFAERLAPLELEPRHAGMLLRLAVSEGQSQQAIGELIGLSSTRMVFLVDELEQRGLVERRRNEADRRSHALYLTEAGWEKLGQVRQVAARHQADLGSSLSADERTQLTGLLRRLAADHGLTDHNLPA